MQVTRTGAIDNNNPLKAASTLSYFHHDHLGSIAAISNAQGAVVERLAFDPWGKRRNANGLPDPADSLAGSYTDRGFTMHEHLDEVGVTHMNGRIDDPLIGRFMSADPFIQAPDNLQSYNRYAYVMNNPLNLTDPSGYFSWRKAVGIASFGILGSNSKTVRTLITIAACIAGGPQACGLATGLNSYVSGASLGQSIKAGVISWATAEGFKWAGTTGPAGVDQTTLAGAKAAAISFERYAAHALVGCVSTVANGGGCGQGAASAVFGKFATNAIGGTPGQFDVYQAAATIVAGGVGSVIAGGKFENGATTAAYGYLFNYCAHNGCFDRRFDWNDAVDQWRNGNGSTVTDVKASELNLTDATYTKNPSGTYQIHTSIKTDTGAIYGTVTGVLNVDGTMSIRPDTYDFDQKNPFKARTPQEFGRVILRDGLTAIGAGINGVGTPYRIEFSGSIPAPKGLPK